MQFAATTNETVDDAWCRDNTVDPRLSFTTHMAPMDMEYNSAATTLFITFRGNWNRESPAGYKLAAIALDNSTGMPVQPADSMEPYIEIMSNEDESRCPDECFRPVGLEWSAENNQLLMAADASGEIYIVYQIDGTPVDDFTVAARQTEVGARVEREQCYAGQRCFCDWTEQCRVLRVRSDWTCCCFRVLGS